MRPFEPGDPGLVGGLWLSGRLGEGPLGVVFLGQQADGTKVAVKLLHAHLTEEPAVWEAYQRAMEALCGLAVPHTARALSTGLVGARPYLMSEYVEGIPLPDIPEPFSAAELERLALRTATALAGLHAAGIPHGALRPSNVIMSAQGAVLTDFGLAPDRDAALAADPADWARLIQSAAGDQDLPPRLRTLTEACLSAVPPSPTELLRQLTAPTSDPGVTVAELAAPPAAFGRLATAPDPSTPTDSTSAPSTAPSASAASTPGASSTPGTPETSWEIPPATTWQPSPLPDAAPATTWEPSPLANATPAASNGTPETPLSAEATPTASSSWEVPPATPVTSWEIPSAASGNSWEIPPAESGTSRETPPAASGTSWEVPPATSSKAWEETPPASGTSWEVPPATPGTSWEIPPVESGTSRETSPAASGNSWEVPAAVSGVSWDVPPVEPQGTQGAQELQGAQGEEAAGRDESAVPEIELSVTAFDAPAGALMGNGSGPSASPDQTVLDSVAGLGVSPGANPGAGPGAGSAAQEWGMETRVEGLPVPGAMPGALAGPVGEQVPPAGPPAPAFDAAPPWAGETSGGRGARRPLLVAAASVTVALLLIGIFAMTRGGGEGDPQPVAAKTGVPPTSEPPPSAPPTEPPATPTPTAPVKAQKNAGSPLPKPPKTTPPPSPTKKPRKPPRNLLSNGGFEAGGFGRWEPRAASFLGAKAAHSGRRAVLLSAGQGYDAAVEYVVTGLKPNTAYQVVGWVRSDVGATFIGAKDFGPVSSYVSSPSTKWTRLSVNFKTGDGTTARIYCWREVPGNGGCDDMAVYRR